MKYKKLIIIILSLLILSIIGFSIYRYFIDEDKTTSLTILEKQWIENNKNKVIDISVMNNIPVLNYHGEGIIFDFLSSLEEKTGLEFNKVSYSLNDEAKTDYAFKKVTKVSDNQMLIYQDNYALITTNKIQYNKVTDIKNLTVGVLNSDIDLVNKYLNGSNVLYKAFDDINEMIKNYESDEENRVTAIVIPKTEYLEKIVSNSKYNITYNISEYTKDYVLSLGENKKLNDILTKYYKKWSSVEYTKSYNTSLSNNYFTFSGITSNDMVKIKSKRYTYGFVKNAPYDYIVQDKLVGSNNSFMTSFAKLASIEIKYKQYDNFENLASDFNEGKVDFYFNSYLNRGYDVSVKNTISPYNNEYVIASHFENKVTVNSLHSLTNTNVMVVKDSKIANYLSNYNISLIFYNNVEEIIKKKSKNTIIALDSSTFDYYSRNKLSKYKVDYRSNISDEYTYLFTDTKDNEQFINYFSFFLSFYPKTEILNIGYNEVFNAPKSLEKMENILMLTGAFFIIGVTLVLFIRFSPKKRKKRKNNLSKEDKLRYIDMLTSLKNRNYLNDHIETWDESEVYPQTIIIVDLNDIAYINDNYGHAEGDAVIKEAANILITNQVANSDIIRTNGNEFLIYLVGYDEKQVVSYMRKLNKELKELAHGFGAAMGYSMINDAIKTIDDAVNEATLDMRDNKEEMQEAR